VLVDLFAGGRRRARVVMPAEGSWPGEVVLCDAAGRAAWSVALRGPWLETTAGRFPSGLAVSRYPTDADPVPQRPIVEVEVAEVVALKSEPDDAAFEAGAPLPGVNENP